MPTLHTFGPFHAGDVAGGNYFQVESDGTPVVHGNAIGYDDILVDINNVKIPASNYPRAVTYNFGVGGGVAFPMLGFAVGEYIDFVLQTSHRMKLNTTLDMHIHYVLPNTTDIGDRHQWQLDVVAAGIGAQWAVPTGSPYSNEFLVAANDDTYHRYGDICDIAAVNTTVSSIYHCRLTRIAATTDEYGSEVYLAFVDAHYQIDTPAGSREEGSK